MTERVSVGRRLWWRVRIAVKDLVCYAGFGSRLIEYCEGCGVRQPLVWWSNNALWADVTGEETPAGDNASGILCPECFDRRAATRGIALRWHPERTAALTPDAEGGA